MDDREKTSEELVEELKHVRDERAHARKRIRALEMAVQNMQLGVTITDAEGHILYTNPAEALMHGYSVEELIGKDARALAPDEYGRPLTRAEVKELKSWTRESVNKRKDGSIFPVKLMSDVVLDDEGVPVAIVTTCEDITNRLKRDDELRQYRESLKTLVEERTREVCETADRLLQESAERKRAEARLAESHERLLAVMDSIPAGVYVADIEDYEILFINQHIQRIFGDVVGKKCWQTFQKGFPGPCHFCTNRKLLTDDGQPAGVYTWEFQNTVTGKWVELHDRAIRWIDGRLVRVEIAIDITERKKTEQSLKESEDKFRSLVEQSLVGIYVLQDGKVRYANPKVADIFGYTQEEILLLKSVLELVLESERPLVEENIRKCMQKEIGSTRYATRGMRKEGTPIDIEVHGTLTLFEGRPAIIGTLLDITERNEIENSLRLALKKGADEKARSEAIIAAIGEGISIQDRDFKVLYQNEVHKELVGDHVGEFCYRGYQRREDVCDGCHLAMSYRDGKVHKKEQVRTTEKGTFYYEIISSPLKDSEGEVIAGIEAVRDITARKRVEEMLRDSEERYRSLVNLSPDAIGVEVEGKIAFINSAGAGMLGARSPEEIMGRPILDFVHPNYHDIMMERVRQMKGSGKRYPPIEGRFRRLDGSEIEVEVTDAVITFGNKPAVQVIFRDITDRKRNAEERERMIAELQQAIASIRTLSGLLPICASCKKIRDDRGYWNQIEAYIRDHTDADFSHSICPDCREKLYPGL
jgi:PAS domain S-box-containing protein